jgi:hypothetical protein
MHDRNSSPRWTKNEQKYQPHGFIDVKSQIDFPANI